MKKNVRIVAVILTGALLLIASASMLSAEKGVVPGEQAGMVITGDKALCNALPAYPDPIDADLVALGEALYFDARLSEPNGQACADCHLPGVGFDDPDADMPVSQGVLPEGRWGNRNSPMSAYAMYAPVFHFDDDDGLYIGGAFWDGRATGDVLGDPLADQALGPFTNPLEMNNPIKRTVVVDVMISDYADLFAEVWGRGCVRDVEAAYDRIAFSIAAFERSELFAAFDSRYDEYLGACIDLGGDPADCAIGEDAYSEEARDGILDDQEWYGLGLFMNENNNDGVLDPGEGAMCSACHVAEWTTTADYTLPIQIPEWADGMIPPLFTDFTFDNLGTPKNPDNPFYHLTPNLNPDGEDWVDYGLGGVLDNPAEYGKHKVMPLRNIGVTAPYLHNGIFDTLAEVVHFYNTRDVEEEEWPAPEVPETVNFDELGNLGLSADDEAALVAFMMTLTDSGEE